MFFFNITVGFTTDKFILLIILILILFIIHFMFLLIAKKCHVFFSDMVILATRTLPHSVIVKDKHSL